MLAVFVVARNDLYLNRMHLCNKVHTSSMERKTSLLTAQEPCRRCGV